MQFPEDRPHEPCIAQLSCEEFLVLLEDGSPEQLEALALTGSNAKPENCERVRWMRCSACSSAPKDSLSAYRAFKDWLLKPAPPALVPILIWWETRRLAYNACVAAPFCAVLLLAWSSTLDCGPENWGYGCLRVLEVAFSYLAPLNLCYTLGFAVETVARAIWKGRAGRIGPALYPLGVGTSFCIAMTFAYYHGFCFLYYLAELDLAHHSGY